MRRIRNIATIAVFATLCALPAWGAKLLIPQDKAVVTTDTLLVIGTGPDSRAILWKIESGGKTRNGTARPVAGGFSINVPLEPGVNRLRVGNQKRDVFLSQGGAKAPRGFAGQRMHGADISRCEDCHEANLQVREGGYPGVCLTCHVVEAQNPDYTGEAADDRHFASSVADCGRCHAPHGANDPKLLRDSSEALCGTCHGSGAGEGDIHPAYEERGCVACHDPHFSGYPKNLADTMPGLCLGCHENTTGADLAKLHPPGVENASCATCHDPHASGGALLRAEGSQLCATCHPTVLTQGHGEELEECSGCHDPHGELGSGMARVEMAEACGECHEGVADGKTVHAALDEGCEACHKPHSDDNVALARATCSECHDFEADGELAGVHGHLPLAAETCSGCHPPHASNQERLVHAKLHSPLAIGECSVCHGGGDQASLEVENTAQRCGMCHNVERSLEEEGAEVHDPVAEGECTACHNPHMSKRSNLLRLAEAKVCEECHDAPDPGEGQKVHAAIETCTDCHKAHGGTNPSFLTSATPDLCLDCHDDPREAEGKMHAALDEGCLVCHDPHMGVSPGLLKGEDAQAVCLECHEDPRAEEKGIHGAVSKRCSECHQPHSSEKANLL